MHKTYFQICTQVCSLIYTPIFYGYDFVVQYICIHVASFQYGCKPIIYRLLLSEHCIAAAQVLPQIMTYLFLWQKFLGCMCCLIGRKQNSVIWHVYLYQRMYFVVGYYLFSMKTIRIYKRAYTGDWAIFYFEVFGFLQITDFRVIVRFQLFSFMIFFKQHVCICNFDMCVLHQFQSCCQIATSFRFVIFLNNLPIYILL
eukprot:TRINITY_DN4602_c1_g2_i1.p3 TRINITY_DN4602_c1_g2~~TRINITY_DN4602_c1_g2_i1.p3  ORF type:complete len:199 (-),score=-19.35 TRINITY_DN4602_c1_g2_i1:89-685(-)